MSTTPPDPPPPSSSLVAAHTPEGAVAEMDAEFADAETSNQAASSKKIHALCKIGLRNAKHYKHIVYAVEKFIGKCRPDLKLAGIYVIDAIVRASVQKLGSKDNYVDRFSKNLFQTVDIAFNKGTTAHQDRVRKVVSLWLQNHIFPYDVVAPIESSIGAYKFTDSKHATPVMKAASASNSPAPGTAGASTVFVDDFDYDDDGGGGASASNKPPSANPAPLPVSLPTLPTLPSALGALPLPMGLATTAATPSNGLLLWGQPPGAPAAAPPALPPQISTDMLSQLQSLLQGAPQMLLGQQLPPTQPSGPVDPRQAARQQQPLQQHNPPFNGTADFSGLNTLGGSLPLKQPLGALQQQLTQVSQLSGAAQPVPDSFPPGAKLPSLAPGNSFAEPAHASFDSRGYAQQQQQQSQQQQQQQQLHHQPQQQLHQQQHQHQQQQQQQQHRSAHPTDSIRVRSTTVFTGLAQIKRKLTQDDFADILTDYVDVVDVVFDASGQKVFSSFVSFDDACTAIRELRRLTPKGASVKLGFGQGFGQKRFSDSFDVDTGESHVPLDKVNVHSVGLLADGGELNENELMPSLAQAYAKARAKLTKIRFPKKAAPVGAGYYGRDASNLPHSGGGYEAPPGAALSSSMDSYFRNVRQQTPAIGGGTKRSYNEANFEGGSGSENGSAIITITGGPTSDSRSKKSRWES